MRLTDNISVVKMPDASLNVIRFYNKEWEYHNLNGPFFNRVNGCMLYRANGQFYNTKGPSVVYVNGPGGYYLDGDNLTEKEWLDAIRG